MGGKSPNFCLFFTTFIANNVKKNNNDVYCDITFSYIKLFMKVLEEETNVFQLCSCYKIYLLKKSLNLLKFSSKVDEENTATHRGDLDIRQFGGWVDVFSSHSFLRTVT